MPQKRQFVPLVLATLSLVVVLNQAQAQGANTKGMQMKDTTDPCTKQGGSPCSAHRDAVPPPPAWHQPGFKPQSGSGEKIPRPSKT
jgi:hypothetical protein